MPNEWWKILTSPVRIAWRYFRRTIFATYCTSRLLPCYKLKRFHYNMSLYVPSKSRGNEMELEVSAISLR
jgi:hypothetical protein